MSAHLFAIPVALLHRDYSLRDVSENRMACKRMDLHYFYMIFLRSETQNSFYLERFISREQVSSAALIVLPLGVLVNTV